MLAAGLSLPPWSYVLTLPALLGGGTHRNMRLEEGAHAVDRPLLQLGRLAPREDRDLRVGCQRGDIDRSLQRVRRCVVRQDQDRRAAAFDKVARDAVEKVGPHPVEIVQI